MKKTRFILLNEVFNKFLEETLKPLRVDNLESMMKNFPSGTAQEFHNSVYESVDNNCREEFIQIMEEKKVKERLDKLDHLYATQKSSYELNMKAFDFEPHDPDRVKRKIVYDAKKQEIERLELILSKLQQENDNLKEQNEEIEKNLFESKKQIQETQEHLQSLVSST